MTRADRLVATVGCSLSALMISLANGQDVEVKLAQPGATEVIAVPAQPMPGQPAAPMPMPGQPMAGQPMPGQPMPGQPMPGQGKPGEKPAAPAAPAVITRPARPETPADPEELKISPDADGKVRFNFQGQPWPDVVNWLAKVSGLSLDWQELPGDHLNLRTQRSYTLEEARDLINRHFLDRGYTLLKQGEVLHVVNLKKLDPSLVPRVDPDKIDDCRPHEFVKVLFPLRSLLAETAVEELKPLLSPNGKISALKATNRIEVLDAAANLQAVANVLGEEQVGGAPKRIVKEFKLQHRRAAEVHAMLSELLGLENKPAGGQPQMSPEQQAMQQMMAMQQQQQNGGQPQPPKAAPKVRLVVDTRENSILAHAPADQMAIIAEAIETVDVPSAKAGGLLRNLNRMQVYRLNSLDPEAVVKVLQELGELDPSTSLKADKANRSIVAYATLADHLTIRQLVEKLDGTGRRFEVIRLRRLEADYVAGTIQTMMGGEEKKKQRRNPYAMFEFGFFGQQQQDDGNEKGKFHVDADVEHNRLLLFANEVELKEITNLLVKLGEIPSENEPPRTFRVLDVDPAEEDELLRRLKEAWPNVSPNPLIVPRPAAQPRDDVPAVPGQTAPLKRPAEAATPSREPAPAQPSPTVPTAGLKFPAKPKLVSVAQIGAENPDEEEGTPDRVTPRELGPTVSPEGTDDPSQPVSPITISRSPDGRLVFHSKDTAALDRLEDLTLELSPPRKDYKLFQLKYPTTWAYGVVGNLKEFFNEDNKEDRKDRRMSMYFGYGGMMGGGSDSDATRRLSKRRPLKFISDSDTNTILVVGADPNQLRIIEELIEMYDQPPANENKAVRKTELFTLKYAKARVVADAIKDVYRDLLSVNDKAMQANNGNNQNQRAPVERSYTFNYGTEESAEKPEVPVKFKGLISLGVDEESNTLIVSSTEGMLENVGQMIKSLEEAARPRASSLQVLTLSGKVDPTSLQQKLQKLVGRPAPQQGQPQNGQQKPGQPQQKQQPQQNDDQPYGNVEETVNFN